MPTRNKFPRPENAELIPQREAIARYFGGISEQAFIRGQARGEYPPTIVLSRRNFQSPSICKAWVAEKIRQAQAAPRPAPAPAPKSVNGTPLVKRGPGRPRKHPKPEECADPFAG